MNNDKNESNKTPVSSDCGRRNIRPSRNNTNNDKNESNEMPVSSDTDANSSNQFNGFAYRNDEELELLIPNIVTVDEKPPYLLHQLLNNDETNMLLHYEESMDEPFERAVDGEYHQSVDVLQKPLHVDKYNPFVSWIYNRVLSQVYSDNEYYQFNIAGVVEPMRFVLYRRGGHNSWHSDYGVRDRSKLSFSLLLYSDSANTQADGQDMHFETTQHGVIPMRVGELLVFPSYVTHRVAPVNNGERIALVGWLAGARFK